jgi:hypothetical protein
VLTVSGVLCINPFRRPKFEHGCGQCVPCRLNRRRTWTARIVLESLAYRESSFVTLTYEDSQLPPDNSLSKAHWREFTKGIGYRYFGCGEYGSHTGRPHYHLVLFGLPVLEAESFCLGRWPYGFVSVRPFSQEHAAYVAAYTVKKLTRADDPRLAPGQIPEFAQMSRRPAVGQRGLFGFSSWLQTRQGVMELARRLDVPSSVRLNGRVFPLGRTMVGHLRAACDIPSDLPARTLEREARFQAERSCPEFVTQLEKRRVARYSVLKARSLRRHGSL